MEDLWHEYESASTPEARVVKDFDKVCAHPRAGIEWHCSVVQWHLAQFCAYEHACNLQLEMILQAHEYEGSQGKQLDEFFDSTEGKWRTELGRQWAAEIVKRRKGAVSQPDPTHPSGAQEEPRERL